MNVFKKIFSIFALVLLGTALVACGTTPSEELSAQGALAIKPAPLVKGGAAVFFNQASANPKLIDPLLVQLKTSPRQALLTIIDYGKGDEKALKKLSREQLDAYVTPFINVLKTTQQVVLKSSQSSNQFPPLNWYYMSCGKVKMINFNTL